MSAVQLVHWLAVAASVQGPSSTWQRTLATPALSTVVPRAVQQSLLMRWPAQGLAKARLGIRVSAKLACTVRLVCMVKESRARLTVVPGPQLVEITQLTKVCPLTPPAVME